MSRRGSQGCTGTGHDCRRCVRCLRCLARRGRRACGGLLAMYRHMYVRDVHPSRLVSLSDIPKTLMIALPVVLVHEHPEDALKMQDPIEDSLAPNARSAREFRVECLVAPRGQRMSSARPQAADASRSSVSGVTANDRHWVRGRRRLAAARNRRSTDVTAGRLVCRRQTPSWCRSTTISNSLKSRDRPQSTMSWRTRCSTTYTNEMSNEASDSLQSVRQPALSRGIGYCVAARRSPRHPSPRVEART